MIAVPDSGPLMALAKVGGLDLLFQLFPRVVATPSVYSETVVAGRRLGASDARLLAERFKEGRIEVKAPSLSGISVPAKIGPGEAESIRLALEIQAEWLLIDDFDARRAAEEALSAAKSDTRIKGTLGVIVSAHQQGFLSREEAVTLLRSLDERPDIWLNRKLIHHVIDSLSA